ncbi:MAG: hypothetical protein MJE68_31910, partial [Proteobacteria bacterium]|nr:hypothetical protein [Pseudomonadota bacterium]
MFWAEGVTGSVGKLAEVVIGLPCIISCPCFLSTILLFLSHSLKPCLPESASQFNIEIPRTGSGFPV